MRAAAPSGVSRRTVLLGTLLPLAGKLPAAGRLPAALAAGVGAEPRALAAWLRDSFPDARAAAAIGALCHRGGAGGQSASALAQALFGCPPSQILERDDFEQRLRRVGAVRARDFRDGDLVLVRGWALARVEAELLALVALCGGD